MSKITLKEFEVTNSSSAGFPGSSRSRKWTTKDFEKHLQIKFIKKKDMELEFDIIGVDASISNAFRRILLSEVPSMAIEKVYIYNNTSIIQDEVLAHRLGLIPLKADPRLFEFKEPGSEDAGTEYDTLESVARRTPTQYPRTPKTPTSCMLITRFSPTKSPGFRVVSRSPKCRATRDRCTTIFSSQR